MKTLVIGAGAAGLTASYWAAQAGASVRVLEGEPAAGRKILISGGGRCNLLPAAASDTDFDTAGSRNVLRRLLRTWPLPAVRQFFEEELGIALRKEPDGKLFPVSGHAQEVRDALVQSCVQAGVQFDYGAKVASIERVEAGWRAQARDGREFSADRLVLAAGGQSAPRTGSDGSGFALAASVGHEPLPPYPALVPLSSNDEELQGLAGLSLPIAWRAVINGKTAAEGTRDLLFTHRGFSGPAVLDMSHYFTRDGAELRVNWSTETRDRLRQRLAESGNRPLTATIAKLIPRRLASLLAKRAGLVEPTSGANLRREARERLLDLLTDFSLPVTGHAGWSVAEVTGGGVQLGEVDPSTLESRSAPGLFFCGELLDVIGRIGGHNFLWAWISGRLAGQSAPRR